MMNDNTNRLPEYKNGPLIRTPRKTMTIHFEDGSSQVLHIQNYQGKEDAHEIAEDIAGIRSVSTVEIY